MAKIKVAYRVIPWFNKKVNTTFVYVPEPWSSLRRKAKLLFHARGAIPIARLRLAGTSVASLLLKQQNIRLQSEASVSCANWYDTKNTYLTHIQEVIYTLLQTYSPMIYTLLHIYCTIMYAPRAHVPWRAHARERASRDKLLLIFRELGLKIWSTVNIRRSVPL